VMDGWGSGQEKLATPLESELRRPPYRDDDGSSRHNTQARAKSEREGNARVRVCILCRRSLFRSLALSLLSQGPP
jgi:hypothetical protein